MTALLFDGQNAQVISHRERAETPPGEAVVRTRLAGVCATDLEIVKGYMGFSGVLGHEFVGDVVEAVDSSLVGSRVVGHINCPRGTGHDYETRDQINHAPDRTVLGILDRDGVFQDTFTIPERNLVRVPDSVPDEHAVFAEPLAAACRIAEQVEISPWHRVAVLGDGRLGLLCAMVLASKAHAITLYGHHPGRIPLPINVRESTVPEAISERFDLVVEATGSADGLATALRLTRPMGTLVLKTTCAGEHRVSLAPVVIDEIQVIGSRCGPLETAIELMEEGRLPLQRLISDRFPLAHADAALKKAAEPGVLKVLIEGTAKP